MSAPTIEIKPDRYFIGIWFIGDGTKDVIISAFRDPGQRWELRYRFRYYHDAHVKGKGDPWDGEDRKSRYGGTLREDLTEDKVEALVHRFAKMLSTGIDDGSGLNLNALFGKPMRFGRISYLPLHSADPVWNTRQLVMQPWAHAKTMTKEEAIKEGYIPPDGSGKETS